MELQRCWFGSKRRPRERRPGVLALLMGKSRRTISRELARGMVLHLKSDLTEEWEHNADHAQMDADHKKTAKGPKPKSGRRRKLLERISQLILKDRRSPYAIVRILWDEGLFNKEFSVCGKTIYNWIDAGDIPNVTRRDLPRGGRRRPGKGGGTPRRRRHSNADFALRSIENRPEEANARREPGHWEGDTVHSSGNSSRASLLTLCERKTRMEIVVKLRDRRAASVRKALDRLERLLGAPKFRRIFRSITFDNGVEFSDVLGLERSCLSQGKRVDLCYAHPYSSSERGTNENHNGIIRRFLPKGTDFAKVGRPRIREVARWMNTCPRRILGGDTPAEAFGREFKVDAGIIKKLEVA